MELSIPGPCRHVANLCVLQLQDRGWERWQGPRGPCCLVLAVVPSRAADPRAHPASLTEGHPPLGYRGASAGSVSIPGRGQQEQVVGGCTATPPGEVSRGSLNTSPPPCKPPRLDTQRSPSCRSPLPACKPWARALPHLGALPGSLPCQRTAANSKDDAGLHQPWIRPCLLRCCVWALERFVPQLLEHCGAAGGCEALTGLSPNPQHPGPPVSRLAARHRWFCKAPDSHTLAEGFEAQGDWAVPPKPCTCSGNEWCLGAEKDPLQTPNHKVVIANCVCRRGSA